MNAFAFHSSKCLKTFNAKVLFSSFQRIADFRSDTVTKPCRNMRSAMANADVGDDVYGEDPSVKRLQEYACYITGKEASLFVPSGTMGNLIAVGVHCQRGEEVMLGNKSHMYLYEAGGASSFMGVSYACVPNLPNGSFSLDDMSEALRDSEDDHFPKTSLLAIENTHNFCGGVPLKRDFLIQCRKFAEKNDLKIHVDGARIANAAISQKTSLKELLDGMDSASICLSKGLGAPVGSILVGSKNFILKGKRLRKGLGGGMRQAGVLAAAGLEGIVNNLKRLEDDHRRAYELKRGLLGIRGIKVRDLGNEMTNMVYFAIEENYLERIGSGTDGFLKVLEDEYGVLLQGGYGAQGEHMRAVTHIDIFDGDVEKCIEAIKDITNK